ncbi:signal recognition particle protein [archaeon]|jgi:signal recognition particle subunit SRP54|nr:signal recognition particle protein [archaeon]MDP6548084.1 signal recognition particle receptor subunit alpha [Candidatus Woesearchaeota archaeon]|tara:strand:+ start:7507 stop:8862 length:1356 start_codon:yes stop_codon:yes gene_type:complete
MVLDKLGSSLKGTLQKIAKSIFVDDKLINELIKDIQRALLQSDMNVKLVFDLTSKIKERIKKEKALSGLTKKEQLVNIVYEELVIFLGKEQHKIEITKKPFKIMLVGLFGSGKTTSAGKLAKYFTKRGNKVALVGLDVHRPAAMTQLEQVSKQANTPCFINKKEKNPIRIYNEFKNELKKFDVIIIDTSGRDALSKDLIQEIESLNKEIKPHENLLVISADIGQAAEKQATQFHKSCNITGVIVSKMDGTARGGGALTACAVSKAPIKFIGVGEKIDDLEHFNPQGFVGRLLGMGDLEALLEKAKHAIKAEDAEDLGKKFLKGEFNLIDLYEQMAAMKKMGSLKKIVEMVPGFSSLQLPKEMLDVQEEKLEKWKIAMLSMTKEELENPDEITSARIDRISKGSAMPTSVIRELIKQYRQSKKVVKMFKGSKGDMSKMMKKFGGKLPGNFKM